jgi:hypothetical protein
MKKLYLIIFEDGSMGRTDLITPALQDSACDGYIDIICISDLGAKITRFNSMDGTYDDVEEIDS